MDTVSPLAFFRLKSWVVISLQTSVSSRVDSSSRPRCSTAPWLPHWNSVGASLLVHLGGQGGLILAGGGGDDLDLHAGLLGVGLGQCLPGLVGLGLEVQIVHASPWPPRRPFAGVLAQATRDRAMTRARSGCKKLSSSFISPSKFIFSARFRAGKTTKIKVCARTRPRAARCRQRLVTLRPAPLHEVQQDLHAAPPHLLHRLAEGGQGGVDVIRDGQPVDGDNGAVLRDPARPVSRSARMAPMAMLSAMANSAVKSAPAPSRRRCTASIGCHGCR